MLAIVSHDAGGAEILSNWAVRQDEPYLLVLDGPAVKVFERKLGRIQVHALQDALEKADWVLTGTSWQSDLENEAIELARMLHKKSVSFLDHWVNYRQRFEVDGDLQLPDEIWVGDEDGYRLAQEIFDGATVCLKTNPYFEDIKEQMGRLTAAQSDQDANPYILYVCSPVREHAKRKFGDERYWGFIEEDAVRFFMNNLKVLHHPSEKVVLRPHPSEEDGKYNWAVDEFSPHVSIGGKRELFDEIAGADVVAGYNSMAMVIGLIAGKRIVNALPPGKVKNTLPMADIEQLNDLLEGQSL